MAQTTITPGFYTLSSSDPYGFYEYPGYAPLGQSGLQHEPPAGPSYWRAAMIFNPPDIPEGSVITGLTLRIQRAAGVSVVSNYPEYGFTDLTDWATADITLYRSLKAMNESWMSPSWNYYGYDEITWGKPWDTPGGDFELIASFDDFAGQEDEWVEFELPADAFSAWGGHFILRSLVAESKDWPYYMFVRYDNPQMVVTYSPPVGRLTLPSWFTGDVPVAELSQYQPLRFFLQNTDHSAATGKTPTVEIRKEGGAGWAAPVGTVTELGYGWYQVAYNAADQNTPGQLLLRATATGCKAAAACFMVMGDTNPYTPATGPVDANLVSVDANDTATDEAVLTLKALYDGGVSRAAVSDYSPTTTTFLTTLPLEDPDHYADQAVVFTSGGLAGQTAHVDTSETEGSLTRLTLAAALTAAPADGDAIIVIGRLA